MGRRRGGIKCPHITPAFIFVCSISLGLVGVTECFLLPTDVRLFPPLSCLFRSPPVINASLHRNVLSWVVWQGQQQKESVYLGAITHSIYPRTSDRGRYRGAEGGGCPEGLSREPGPGRSDHREGGGGGVHQAQHSM